MSQQYILSYIFGGFYCEQWYICKYLTINSPKIQSGYMCTNSGFYINVTDSKVQGSNLQIKIKYAIFFTVDSKLPINYHRIHFLDFCWTFISIVNLQLQLANGCCDIKVGDGLSELTKKRKMTQWRHMSELHSLMTWATFFAESVHNFQILEE